jgi:oxygen-independent coproporphyrinogen-3 oxidase
LIYAHIPFCESKCPYCSFNSFAARVIPREEYIAALIRQFESDRREFGLDRFGSLYIGGGTPSIFAAESYAPFFEKVSPFLAEDAEITIEANPVSLTLKWAKTMRSFGVNRISVGVQSFCDRKLRVLGRAHNAKEAKTAIAAAIDAGFEQISVDFIYGVLGDDLKTLLNDLSEAKKLGAAHISAYALTIEEDTPIDRQTAIDDLELERAFSEAIEEARYPRYEVSNYGVAPSAHNAGYWEGRDYLGLGAGAIGNVKRGDSYLRYAPRKAIGEYMRDPLCKTTEAIDEKTRNDELLMLGLRCDHGFEARILSEKERERADFLARNGRLNARGERYFNADFWLSDEIWLYIKG